MTFIPTIPTPADLWREARAWLADALKRFGGPAGIAATRARRSLNAVRRRLRALESLVTKLLLIHAARLPSSPACGGGAERSEAEGRVRTRTRPPRSRAHAHHISQSGEHAKHRTEEPATWRVSFRPCIPPAPTRRRRAGGSRPRAPFDPERRAYILARRCEALVRVIANPRAAIRALARKLRALGGAACDAARRIAWFIPPRRRRERISHAHAVILASDACAAFHADDPAGLTEC